MQKILSVAGPTASGKTGLSIALAKKWNGEVVSCDSMQIYKGMAIGTAAPTAEEMDGIPHHLIGICSPDDTFSAAEWTALARQCIDAISARGKLPILCGGTGLYLDSLTKISQFSENTGDSSVREELQQIAEVQGAEVLHKMLSEIDPEAAEAIHPNNVKRVIRAIEIYRVTGMTKTETDKLQTAGNSLYREFRLILTYQNRDVLYERIDRRVGLMLDAGLLEEAKALYDSCSQTGTARQAIGYKELLPYFQGLCSLEEAADQIRQSSRRYAKRQITWFKRGSGYPLVMDNADGSMRSLSELLDEIEQAAKEADF
ncbi:MAG: tRNA (adenosine(37)-N6)-dimethylallyltransferase MiaA [Clostridia bacterium]|nr:tRNA (adenosine(37)-N6)-dimethylallyltransferase MiaA [Clostridia bacterium]